MNFFSFLKRNLFEGDWEISVKPYFSIKPFLQWKNRFCLFLLLRFQIIIQLRIQDIGDEHMSRCVGND